MRFTRFSSLAFTLSMAVASPLPAAIFNFKSGGLVRTLDGITATATGWSTTGSGGLIQNASAIVYNGAGLGVCNRTETGCPSPAHQVDNAGYGVDFVMVTFSSNVIFSNAVLASFGPSGADRDVTYYLGTLANPLSVNLAGLTLAGLPSGFGAAINSDTNSSTNPRTVLFGDAGPANAILIGARTGAGADSSRDYFKLQSLTVSSPGSDVPEPSTYGLIGSALVAIALYSRKAAR